MFCCSQHIITLHAIKFIYDLLIDSFYIIALFLIVKDAFKYELIGIAKRGW